jgi:gamma-polyglutamate synthase
MRKNKVKNIEDFHLLTIGLTDFEKKIYNSYAQQIIEDLTQQGVKDLNLRNLLGRVIFILREKNLLYLQREEEYNKFLLIPSPTSQQLSWFARRLNERVIWLKNIDALSPSREALTDLYYARQGELQQQIFFLLNRLRFLGVAYIEEGGKWGDFDFTAIAYSYVKFRGDARIRSELFLTFSYLVEQLSTESLIPPLTNKKSPFGLAELFKSANKIVEQRSDDTWVQCAAYRLIGADSFNNLSHVIKLRFNPSNTENLDTRDELFVKDYLVTLLADNLKVKELDYDFLIQIARDSSSFVRQSLINLLKKIPNLDLLKFLAISDNDYKVRALAITTIIELFSQTNNSDDEWLTELLESEQNTFVLRSILRALVLYKIPFTTKINQTLKNRIACDTDELHRKNLNECYLELWSQEEKFQTVKTIIYNRLPNFGKSFVVKKRELKNLTEEEFFKLLLVCANQGFGFDVVVRRNSYKIFNGFQFKRRLWRLIFEFFNPASDKRQAFKHLKTRSYVGRVRINSELCCEVTPAKVPGEPVLIRRLGGWFSSLPLLEDILATLKNCLKHPFYKAEKRETRIYSLSGVTTVKPPSFWSSLISYFKVSLRFQKIANLRVDPGEGKELFYKFKDELEKLGVSVHTVDHSYLLLSPFVFSGEPFFVSSVQLTFIIVTLLVFYLWSFIVENTRIDEARNSIPLVIGGWGSRGKSGTERLKAALFNGLGLGMVSKSTGCEAMIVVGRPFDKIHEISLFRPYDKATIWEQRDVLTFAQGFKPQVFLWECMGLNPIYVTILRRWMRDDYSTITNTYPDHEDIQGPSGIDVAKTISEFIPPKGRVICTEEQMYPILEESAKLKGSTLIRQGWYEAGLITDDVLARFPYLEHPYNIALVLKLAEELKISRSFALKEMADRVVADLGVLKISPVAEVNGRKLQFINGMSANERTGCLNNWNTTGFSGSDFDESINEFLVGVVNNRADRVARSKVFAQIIVQDLNADQYVLIGTNLQGLQGMLKEEWQGYIKNFSIFEPNETIEQAYKRFDNLAKRLRVPTDKEALSKRLALLPESEGSERFKDIWESFLGSYNALTKDISSCLSNTDKLELTKRVKTFFSEVFFSKIKIIADKSATGEEIISEISELVPKNITTRIMGLQNIKGTGLDFVYQWEKWSKLHKACESILIGSEPQFNKGINHLLEYSSYGLLAKKKIEEVLKQKLRYSVESSKIKTITTILNNSQVQSHSTDKTDKQTLLKSIKQKILKLIANLLEVTRAIDRKLRAKSIYKKIITHEIAYDDAREKLWKLYKEQDGEWLG